MSCCDNFYYYNCRECFSDPQCGIAPNSFYVGNFGLTGQTGQTGQTGNVQRRVVYIDSFLQQDPSIDTQIINAADAGFNDIVLGFRLFRSPNNQPTDFPIVETSGTNYDSVTLWSNLTPLQRSTVKSNLAARNPPVKLFLSMAGATEYIYLYHFSVTGATGGLVGGVDPVIYANDAVNAATSLSFDGIDYDLENFIGGAGVGLIGQSPSPPAMTQDQTLKWLIALHDQTRTAGWTGLVSHAPQPPYLSPAWAETSNYVNLDVATRNNPNGGIDYYNIQYYNQGANRYITFQETFNFADPLFFPQSSINEIAQQLITSGLSGGTASAYSKIVMLKPLTSTDASSGYISPDGVASETLNKWYNGPVVGIPSTPALNFTPPYSSIGTFKWNNLSSGNPDSAADWLNKIFP